MSIMEGKRDVLAECKAKLETTLKVPDSFKCVINSKKKYIPSKNTLKYILAECKAKLETTLKVQILQIIASTYLASSCITFK